MRAQLRDCLGVPIEKGMFAAWDTKAEDVGVRIVRVAQVFHTHDTVRIKLGEHTTVVYPEELLILPYANHKWVGEEKYTSTVKDRLGEDLEANRAAYIVYRTKEIRIIEIEEVGPNNFAYLSEAGVKEYMRIITSDIHLIQKDPQYDGLPLVWGHNLSSERYRFADGSTSYSFFD